MLTKTISAIIGILIMTSSVAFAQYGGGGGTSFTVLASSIHSLSGQNPSATITGVCGIEQIIITLKQDAGSFTLSVLEISKPTNIPVPPGEEICYYRITIPQSINALMDRAEIHLKLPKSKLTGINPDSVILYRFNDGSSRWEPLPTTKVSEDSSFVFYTVTTNSFSFFVLSGEAGGVPEAPSIPFSKTFTIEGFDVPITLTNGNVDDVNLNINEVSLEIMLSGITKDAELTIEIPRGLLDALNPDGSDTEFTVMFDGKFADYTEEKHADKRILKINVPEGTAMITILGTFVVPEFGILALIVFATAIGSIIAVRRYSIKL